MPLKFPTQSKTHFSNFDDKHDKQDVNFKETIEEIIAEQDAKFDAKFENKLQTLSLQIKEDSTKSSSKLDAQDKKLSSFKTSYDSCPEKISTRNKNITKIEISKTELEATMNMILDEFKYETVSSFDMKLSTIT